MDPSIVVLVLKDLTQQIAEMEARQIQLWKKGQEEKQEKQQEESTMEKRGE